MDGWTDIGSTICAVESVAVSKDDPNRMFAGTLEGFYTSDNQGLSWQKEASGDFKTVIPTGGDHEAVITGGDICHFRIYEPWKADEDRWTEYTVSFPNVLHSQCGCVCPGTTDEVFIGTALGIFRLVREGDTWQSPERIVAHGWKDPIHQDLHMFPDDPDTIYSGTYPNGLMIFRRPASGQGPWEILEPGSLPADFGNLNSLCVDPESETVYIASSSGNLYKTPRNTIEWTAMQIPPDGEGLAIRNMLFNAHYGLLVEFGSRLYQYKNGEWLDLKSPELLSTGYRSIDVCNNNYNIVVGSNSGCFVYSSLLKTWQMRNRHIANLNLNCACFHPLDEFSALLGTQDTGVFYTVDGGTSWILSNRGIASLVIHNLARDPLHPDTVYAAGGDTLSKSEDNGRTWRQVGWLGDRWIPGRTVDTLAVNGKSVLLVGTDFKADMPMLFRSEDGGETFAAVDCPFSGGSVHFCRADMRDSSRILCGVENAFNEGALWVSNDAGVTFTDGTPELGDRWSGSEIPQALQQDPGNPLMMWMAVSYKGMYRSLDGGETWDLPQPATPYWTSLALDSGQTNVLCAAADESIWPYREVFLSYDHGETWDWSGVFDTEIRTKFVASDPYRHRIWVARRDGYIWESVDQCSSWTQKGNYYISTVFTVNDLAVSPRNPDVLYMATENHGVWKSNDAGWHWEEASWGIPAGYHHVRCIDVDTRLELADQDRLLLGCADSENTDHRVYESIDGAGTLLRKDSAGGFNSPIVDLSIVELPVSGNSVWLTTYGDGAWLSIDGGMEWRRQSIDPPPPGDLLTSITHTPYGDENDEPWIFVSSHGGGGSFIWNPGDGRFIRRNRGLPGAGGDDVYVDLIRADPVRTGVFWASTPEGLYGTTDFGNQWFPSFSTDPMPVNGIIPRRTWLTFDNEDIYYCRNDLGVLRSQDGLIGKSWTTVNTALTPEDQEHMAVLIAAGAEERRHLFAGLTGRACLTHPVSLTIKPTGSDIRLGKSMLRPGDLFELSLTLSNTGSEPLDVYLCLLMDVYGTLLWWPSWTSDIDASFVSIPPGQEILDVLSFTWPDGAGTGQITFYAGLLSPQTGALIGDFDWAPLHWIE